MIFIPDTLPFIVSGFVCWCKKPRIFWFSKGIYSAFLNQFTKVIEFEIHYVLQACISCKIQSTNWGFWKPNIQICLDLVSDLMWQDALTLQRVALEKKAELVSDEANNEVPDLRSIIQEMMTSLFISVFSAQVTQLYARLQKIIM